mmetsp:Transcript_33446/g.38079  ORF Transcript_33446/g.38079 Transcript_33446/m.38079 type:complete len:270 (+) Transcript_33446:3-812(+)
MIIKTTTIPLLLLLTIVERRKRRKGEGRKGRKRRVRNTGSNDITLRTKVVIAKMIIPRRTTTNHHLTIIEEKKKRRKRSRDRKKHKKSSHKKEKKKKRSPSPDVPTFGKYGIIQPSKDMKRKERSFQIWMAEVKVIPSFTGSKYELQEYFKEYAEDYNTATLPHTKYYDYDKWEMEEYKKKMEKENKRITSSKGGSKMLADEAKHRAEVHQRAVDKKESDMQFVRATVMNSDKLQDMKRQRDLQAELQHAFKTGDKEKVRKIKQKLEPD